MEIGQNKPPQRDEKEINIENTQRWEPDEAARDTFASCYAVTHNIQARGPRRTEQTQFAREHAIRTKHMHQMPHQETTNAEELLSAELLVTRSLVEVQYC
jgi:uncharacterized membrane protein YccC